MRNSWESCWSDVAISVAKRSMCSRRKIGCVIVDKSNRILSTGYNGPPPGYALTPGTNDCVDFCPRAIEVTDLHGYTDCLALHAESNCLSYTDPIRAIGGSAYITGQPCFTCAKLLAGAQLSNVYVPYWEPMHWKSVDLLKASGIIVGLLSPTIAVK